MSRRLFIAGNWKMHKGPLEADALCTALKKGLVDNEAVDVAVAPPYVSIPAAAARLQHTGIHVAGQDLHWEVQGAFTSQVPGEMLRQAGCTYVIVGHSERRSLFGDDDEAVGKKVHAAFRSGLLPILCVGETLPEREAGQAVAVVTRQLAAGFAGLALDQAASVTVAYEPVWAIGTGRTATPQMAQDMHAEIRSWLASALNPRLAEQIRIQYGGSVKASNAAELLAQPDIDGALVGGAALDADSFLAIVAAGTRPR